MRATEEKKLIAASVMEYFARVPDPRVKRTRAHPLVNILVIALLAVMCGADSFTTIEEFGRIKKKFLATFLDLENGIPSHDTFGRVLSLLDPLKLQDAFRQWVAELVQLTKGEVIAIDGKTLRRSFREAGSKAFVHMVSAWATHNRVVLGQVKTDEKSNEITAIPKLLEMLQIKGAVVTIDAMGCQKDIADRIVAGGADYLLAVKNNQPTLHADIVALFDQAKREETLHTMGFFETRDRGHGREEIRRGWTCTRFDSVRGREDWTSLSTVVQIESERTVGDKTSIERRHYISSRKNLGAHEALQMARSHWGIENELHWVLDVAFREDDCRVRAGNAAENFAVLRHITLNLLKHANCTRGIKTRRLKAGWDNDFLLETLCNPAAQ